MFFPELKACRDIDESSLAFFSRTRELTVSFLNRLSQISSPYDCEAYLLSFFARVVLRSWIQNEIILDIRVIRNYVCCFTLLSKMPDGTEEIIYQNDFNVSINTLLEIITLPNAVLPFKLKTCSPEHIILEAEISSRTSTLPPPEFSDADAEISAEEDGLPTLYTQINGKKSGDGATSIYLRPHPVAMLVACASTVDRTIYADAKSVSQLDEEWEQEWELV